MEDALAVHQEFWTNPSVLLLAGKSDPVNLITDKAREAVLKAVQAGWQGPPFDPFKLAAYLGIPTVPREDLLDARIVSLSPQRVQIEFNPHRSRGRIRFSIAHELAHTLFPDYVARVRNRGGRLAAQSDDWQLELLCNIAASEFIMPVGEEIDSATPVTIDNLMRLQKQFDVSTEAISIRLAKITRQPCTIIAAARTSDNDSRYRIDYSVPSRTSTVELPRGLEIDSKLLSQCTAVGYTAKGPEQWVDEFGMLDLECVGIPPYPGKNYPRVIGIGSLRDGKKSDAPSIKSIRGDALEPRGSGRCMIAHIVNDKTPNWGAGFGRAVRTKYPEVQRDFREWATSYAGQFLLGNIHLSSISEDAFVASMIAQHGYGESAKPRIRYSALKSCLSELKTTAKSQKASVHMPRIGTGHAGGNWGYILELIDEVLVRDGVDVTVYTLPEYEPNEIQGTLGLSNAGVA